MSEDTHKTMSYSRRNAQDTEITFKFAADATAEHPYASTARGMAVERTCAHFQGQDGLPGWSPGQCR